MAVSLFKKSTLPVKLRVSKVIPNKGKGKANGAKRSKNKNVVRGKEVTVRDSSSVYQILYGRMKVGGIATYVDTSSDSKAYVVTGNSGDDNELVWTAKTSGASGNNISVHIIVTGTNSTRTVSVDTSSPPATKISIRLKSTSGASLDTMANVITAIRGDATANALIAISKLDSTKNGFVDNVDEVSLSYGGGTWLHQYITLAGNQIDAVEALYLDDKQVTLGGTPDPRWGTGIYLNKVFMAVQPGYDGQEAQPDLMGQKPGVWTSTDKQDGCAGVYLILIWNDTLFPQGLPEINFLVRGKLVFDPRTSTTAWTRNAALIVADFLNDARYGYGISYADIDTDALSHAANVCDEQVDLIGGGTEDRYSIDGVFDASATKDETLQELLTAMAGYVVIEGSTRYIYAGEYRSPSVEFTEDDLRSSGTPVSFTTHIARSNSFNGVRATFADPTQSYNETDVPAIQNSTYVTEDRGIAVFEDLTLNFVTKIAQAQRLMKIELERVRQGIVVTLQLKLCGLLVQPADTVYLTLPQFGWDQKIFEVMQVTFVIGSDNSLGVDLDLREISSGVYDWDSGEETTVDTAPDTDLPDPTDVQAPSGVALFSGTDQLYIRLDGTVQTRVLMLWDASDREFVQIGGRYDIQFKRHDVDTWTNAPSVPGDSTFTYITDVQDGVSYDFRIREVNTIGAKSDFTEVDNYTVIGKTEPPSNVATLTVSEVDFGIFLSWTAVTDVDLGQYELRFGSDWNSGTLIARTKAINYGWNFQVAGTYHLMVKAIDTSNNYSVSEAAANITINSPGTTIVTSVIDGPNLILSWSEPSADFAIKEYEVRYGASYAGGIGVAVLTAKHLTLPITWGGLRSFWVSTRDIAGNTGTAGQCDINVLAPNPIGGFVTTVVENNVLLDWDEPILTTLPIQNYIVYKGDDIITAEVLGIVYGTFHTYVEKTGGTFTYHVIAIDTAGNQSTDVSTTATVTEPSDFYIKDDSPLLPSYYSDSRHAIIGGSTLMPDEDPLKVFLPVASTVADVAGPLLPLAPAHETFQTWAEFFTSHGFSSMQDAIDAGYPAFGVPSTSAAGYIEFLFDYEVTFDSSFIELSWTEDPISGHVTYTPKISFSPDNISYTEVDGDQVFASNFRYVKYRLEFVGDDDKALSILTDLRARISLKIDEEYGQANVLASDFNVNPDLNGTFVTFVKDFLDVRDIQVTPKSNTAAYVVMNFEDVPNPLGFRVLLFDSSGARLSGVVSYRVIGAVTAT